MICFYCMGWHQIVWPYHEISILNHKYYQITPPASQPLPSKHDRLCQCWFTVGSPSATLARRQTNLDSPCFFLFHIRGDISKHGEQLPALSIMSHSVIPILCHLVPLYNPAHNVSSGLRQTDNMLWELYRELFVQHITLGHGCTTVSDVDTTLRMRFLL